MKPFSEDALNNLTQGVVDMASVELQEFVLFSCSLSALQFGSKTEQCAVLTVICGLKNDQVYKTFRAKKSCNLESKANMFDSNFIVYICCACVWYSCHITRALGIQDGAWCFTTCFVVFFKSLFILLFDLLQGSPC